MPDLTREQMDEVVAARTEASAQVEKWEAEDRAKGGEPYPASYWDTQLAWWWRVRVYQLLFKWAGLDIPTLDAARTATHSIDMWDIGRSSLPGKIVRDMTMVLERGYEKLDPSYGERAHHYHPWESAYREMLNLTSNSESQDGRMRQIFDEEYKNKFPGKRRNTKHYHAHFERCADALRKIIADETAQKREQLRERTRGQSARWEHDYFGPLDVKAARLREAEQICEKVLGRKDLSERFGKHAASISETVKSYRAEVAEILA